MVASDVSIIYRNVIFEHENRRTILEYDFMWHVSINSDENELEYIDKNEWNFSNEDEEYMEFTRNDSDHGLKYA